MLSKSEAKYIQTLSQKKLREAEGHFIIEGPKITGEALQANNVTVEKIYATEDWIRLYQPGRNIALVTVSESELQRISQLKTPNQVLTLVQLPAPEKFVFRKNALSLMLDGIQDPGNMGTIIRIADWFGIKQVICSNDCADAYSPKVVQATMGSIFRIELYYTELAKWINDQADIELYGAALDGAPLKTFTAIKEGVLVIGNESKGIRDAVMKRLTGKITIERLGEAESLNAAIATGIILSHIV